MQKIIHFCFIQHPAANRVSLDGLLSVASQVDTGECWSLWVSPKGNGEVQPALEGSFLVGQMHANGDGLYAKVGVRQSSISFCSDVISGIPIFIFEMDGAVLVSSSLAILIRACRQLGIRLTLDMGACSEMMLASYVFIRGRTLLENVRRLLPNHELQIDLYSGKVAEQRVAQDFSYVEQPQTWQWCVDNLKAGIVHGLKRYEGQRVAVMLSGGADSRIIAACAIEARLNPDFITFGQSTVNASDFPIASVVAHRLGRPIRPYTASADQFRENWKSLAEKSNWSDMWALGKLPWDFFEGVSEYDVVLRGDGEGIYGWKSGVGSVVDVLHQLEISPMVAVLRSAVWFKAPEDVFELGEESRKSIIEEYREYHGSLSNLKNELYQSIREYGCIAQNIWLLDNWMVADAPLLWQNSVEVARRIPSKYRTNKQVIFAVLNTFGRLKDVPFSTGSSWNDPLENWYSGLTNELIDYVSRWSPWAIDRGNLEDHFSAPPPVPGDQCDRFNLAELIKARLQRSPWVRRQALERYPERVYSSFSSRGLTRLAVISNLREYIERDSDD